MDDEEHKIYHTRMIIVATFILLLLFGGAYFYYRIEKWRYLNALYFSAYTMTTVGYGDFTPKTDLGKIFTIVYLFTGVGVALYGLSLMASHFVEVREEFWLERIEKTNIRRHTGTVWGKIKDAFNYRPGILVKEYENSVKRKK